MNFSDQDIKEIEAHGLTVKQVEKQIDKFVNGVPNVKLVAAATIEDGIFKLTDDEERQLQDFYNNHKDGLKVVKFTPASGAASRMFKAVYQFLEEYDINKETVNEYIDRTGNKDIQQLLDNRKKFPFYERIEDILKDKYSEGQLKDENFKKLGFLKIMMGDDDLAFGNYPKGLLPFHNYEGHSATAFEEHFHESAAYAAVNDKAHLHFTVSPEHKAKFESHLKDIQNSISSTTGISYEVDYSFQKKATDTVAVTLDNELYRMPDGKLLFRPGGHGALIENLNDIDADVVFIKNIDNVLVQDKIHTLAHSKKILAGLLLKLQEKVFKYHKLLEEDSITDKQIEELELFLKNDFSTRLDSGYSNLSFDNKKQYLIKILNRPMRICGMVKNEGEPGGGPFWVENEMGKTDLQIIESAQVNLKDDKQQKIFNDSTHFNPVDIAAGLRNYKGEKFDLTKFVNPDLAFIASKTTDGNKIKALELPGLWNGAMALWNTIFVEVPLETFNPVKTVNDLLKPAHQVSKS
ncbi:MAG: DUF4301 family protein [Leeuwenhoekiella sp.]